MSELEEAAASGTKMATELFAKHLLPCKQQEWASLVAKKEPLQILDLPLDILQTILREVTHTNDLCSLALTHSILHELVTPYIYSRFDIVWPDANPNLDTRIGVDALTYGLATLVMGHDVFGEAQYQQAQQRPCAKCDHENETRPPPPRLRKTRRGNHFAQYTRKFSLGNGPPDWVQEYLINKEGGKMLGTLVALAVGRMRNLETFIWDMPTGVLRDVWLALASLGDREDGQQCRLEKVWVRWHDNQEQAPLTPPPMMSAMAPQNANFSAIPTLLAGSAQAIFQIPPYPRVEFPTFSILPPLRSLSVLDIDELPYAEEMSVLIERSLDRLEELRVGVAQHAQYDTWAAEDRSFVPPPPSTEEHSFRAGGILGVITALFSDPFDSLGLGEKTTSLTKTTRSNAQPDAQPQSSLAFDQVLKDTPVVEKHGEDNSDNNTVDIDQLSAMLSAQSLDHAAATKAPVSATPLRRRPTHALRRMKLSTLELERVYLSLPVFASTIDWQRLRSLTLLGCRNHDSFWKELRRQFKPTSSNARKSSISIIASPGAQPALSSDDFMLKITRIHTDLVSPALMACIKDTLAPDTLEWLFLQEIPIYKSTVTMDMIYKAIRRHRGSLKKLLIDSGYRTDGDSPDTNWRRWVLNRDLITSITSGKMQLRELSVALEYKDWHFFLQRLPGASTIRSLHISHIADHVHGSMDAREAALQVLDIVALRPDLELCYLAVQSKCFEVLEQDACRKQGSVDSATSHIPMVATHHNQDDDADEDDLDDDDDDEDDHSVSDMLSSNEDASDEEGKQGNNKSTFKLREILFYDDKVSIFRARHGRL